MSNTIDRSRGNPSTRNSGLDNNQDQFDAVNSQSKISISEHTNAIQQFSNFNDVSNYIQNNILTSSLNEAKHTITNLIKQASQQNPKLAAVIYHAADEHVRLTVINRDQEGNRRLELESLEVRISDEAYPLF